ncbi:unnamed protein product [Adineta steineri]|uniref:Uncharacterized protein n=1 Tax=Adineta steineri TaxID=433720 RepID=A0A814MZD2_9BILA|nr:unnamed protein product [Adineta steineri]CAF1174966.1 unnamed protein product [Adineta steineri]
MDNKVQGSKKCYGKKYTFDKLRQMNITGDKLFQWLAPIDLINDYELFLTEYESKYGLNEYCNCSSEASFGIYCQYQFDISKQLSILYFDIVINKTFSNKYKRPFQTLNIKEDLTCYSLFNCTSLTGLCLDWREICNGRFDCTNGQDEINCSNIEFNECDIQNEYRCRNGMCIPKIFSFDLTIDCLDFDDEQEQHDKSALCYYRSSVDCEEHHCGRLGGDSFSCGDGSCSDSLSSCNTDRDDLQLRQLFAYDEDLYGNNLTLRCFKYIWCKLEILCLFQSCSELGQQEYCNKLPKNESLQCNLFDTDNSQKGFFFPPTSFIFSFVRLYVKISFESHSLHQGNTLAICIDKSKLCDMSRYPVLDTQITGITFTFQQYNCGRYERYRNNYRIKFIAQDLKALVARCAFPDAYREHLLIYRNKSSFLCQHHFSISSHRINDDFVDCVPFGMVHHDEEVWDMSRYTTTDRYICTDMNITIPRRLVADGQYHCDFDELFPVVCTNQLDCRFLRDFNFSLNIPLVEFPALCDGYTAYQMNNINDTDETDCEDWPCLSRATRCDGTWNRPNGCDELDCPLSLPSAYIAQRVGNCSKDEHYCLQYNSSSIKCLSVTKANDHIIDCLFASDERWWKGKRFYNGDSDKPPSSVGLRLPCTATKPTIPILSEQICNCKNDCGTGADDELVCPWQYRRHCSSFHLNTFTCKNGTQLSITDRCNQHIDCVEGEDEWGCDFKNIIYPAQVKTFSPSEQSFSSISRVPMKRQATNSINDNALFHCHRGILIREQTNLNYCLCPPSYFGNRCEWQSERITLSFDSEILRSAVDLNVMYRLVFYLVNEYERRVLDFETLLYAPFIHSPFKHILYLRYPREYLLRSPQHRQIEQISVYIDAYIVTRTSVYYSISWYFPVLFPFLPANRLAFRLVFQEPRDINRIKCSQLDCKNGGLCQTYINTDEIFCRCPFNWSGLTCEEQAKHENLSCHTHAQLANYLNHTFCLCPLGRTGRNCHVKYDTCPGVYCYNNGTCIPGDDRTKEYICQCSREYFGNHCQYRNALLHLYISERIKFAPILNILMLHLPSNAKSYLLYRNAFLYRNVQPDTHFTISEEHQRFLSMFIFAQIIDSHESFYGTYYLLHFTNIANLTESSISITPEKRCYHVSEYLNKQIIDLPWLKRVKLYHKYFKDVQCFYDEFYMCFIDKQQLPECFHFNHAHSNCTSDRQYCENNGRCFRHKHQYTGELTFACICPKCFSGSFCQLNMHQFSFTFDSLLGETIITGNHISDQPLLIKFSLSFISIICAIGFISNLASFLTFIQRELHRIGTVYYLLILSILSQITLFVFLFRFLYSFINLTSLIGDYKLLSIACSLFDFLLSLLVSTCDWLTACLTCERTISVIQGIKFNQQRSIRLVKIISPSIFLILTLTSIHQLFSRHLITDPRNDARQWCIVKYPYQWLQTYDIIIKFIHSTIPFLINLISAIVLFVICARKKQRINNKEKYSTIFIKQVRQHKHLLFSPLITVAFKLPLLIVQISFKCISDNQQLHVSLIAYFISNIPLAMTFIVFVWVSPSYYKVFVSKLIRRFI